MWASHSFPLCRATSAKNYFNLVCRWNENAVHPSPASPYSVAPRPTDFDHTGRNRPCCTDASVGRLLPGPRGWVDCGSGCLKYLPLSCSCNAALRFDRDGDAVTFSGAHPEAAVAPFSIHSDTKPVFQQRECLRPPKSINDHLCGRHR